MTHDVRYRHRVWWLVFLLVFQVAIFLPGIGKGFITDDFIWLDNVLEDGQLDFSKPFSTGTGFYRPLVSLSFGFQYLIHGTEPLPYSVFNILIHVLNIVLIYLLLNSFSIARPYALTVAFLFSMNIKANTMAVGWLSGRTTLLFAFFGLLTFFLIKKWRTAAIGEKSPFISVFLLILINLVYLAALLSKESALIIPVAVFVFTLFFNARAGAGSGSAEVPSKWKKTGSALVSTLVFIPPLLVYFLLRLNSNAFTPLNAPDCYRFRISIPLLMRNLWEYFSRSGLLDMVLAVILILLAVLTGTLTRSLKKMDIRLVGMGAVFFLVFLIPVIFLPVRSDLYVYFPQTGYHLCFAVLLVSLLRYLAPFIRKCRTRVLTAVILVALLGVWSQEYFHKARLYGESGRTSSHFLRQVAVAVSPMKNNSHLVIIDLNRSDPYSPLQTVSYGMNAALKLFYFYPYKKVSGEIVRPGLQPGQNLLKRKFIRFFLWNHDRLIGPVTGSQWVGFFSLSLPPGTCLPVLKIKPRRIGRKRLTRLQKHRLGIEWMRKVREEHRNRNQNGKQ